MGSLARANVDLGMVRRHHLSLALESLLDEGPASRARLAKRIGVTKATMSALAGDLLDRGLVEERAIAPDGRIGRPAADLAPAGSVGALGLEIGVDRVVACVVDLAGQVRVVRRRAAANRRMRPARALDRLTATATGALEAAAAAGIQVLGGGLAVPGLVDPATRAVLVAPNLHWLDVDLGVLDDRIGFPLVVENEANLGALAELRHGAARGLRSFVFVSADVGIGAGLVLGGALVRGAHGFAGELGHVVVDPDGPRCACGARGCLETFLGADSGSGGQPDRLVGALATALRSVVHLVDPEVVVLGGSLADRPDLTEALTARLAAATLGGRRRPCLVHRSVLGPEAAAIGAATTVLDAVIADPTLVPPAALTA